VLFIVAYKKGTMLDLLEPLNNPSIRQLKVHDKVNILNQ